MQTVYILYSQKINKFYIGYTSDIKQRMQFHLSQDNNRFTRVADDWKIFYKLECVSKKQALAIEKHIKKMKSSEYIRNLKKYPEIGEKLLHLFQEE